MFLKTLRVHRIFTSRNRPLLHSKVKFSQFSAIERNSKFSLRSFFKINIFYRFASVFMRSTSFLHWFGIISIHTALNLLTNRFVSWKIWFQTKNFFFRRSTRKNSDSTIERGPRRSKWNLFLSFSISTQNPSASLSLQIFISRRWGLFGGKNSTRSHSSFERFKVHCLEYLRRRFNNFVYSRFNGFDKTFTIPFIDLFFYYSDDQLDSLFGFSSKSKGKLFGEKFFAFWGFLMLSFF